MTYDEEIKKIHIETVKQMEDVYATIKTVPGQLDGALTDALKVIDRERSEKIKAVKKKYGK